jgi:hypothetical protein
VTSPQIRYSSDRGEKNQEGDLFHERCNKGKNRSAGRTQMELNHLFVCTARDKANGGARLKINVSFYQT